MKTFSLVTKKQLGILENMMQPSNTNKIFSCLEKKKRARRIISSGGQAGRKKTFFRVGPGCAEKNCSSWETRTFTKIFVFGKPRSACLTYLLYRHTDYVLVLQLMLFQMLPLTINSINLFLQKKESLFTVKWT
jgi:hypothetical protein